jgi:hypothetical protein
MFTVTVLSNGREVISCKCYALMEAEEFAKRYNFWQDFNVVIFDDFLQKEVKPKIDVG